MFILYVRTCPLVECLVKVFTTLFLSKNLGNFEVLGSSNQGSRAGLVGARVCGIGITVPQLALRRTIDHTSSFERLRLVFGCLI